MSDRDELKRGNKLPMAPSGEVRVKKLIFRNLFIQERDAEITQIMWNYFAAVAQRWPQAWPGKKPGLILNRTTGYRALMRFLPLAYLTLGIDSAFPTAEFKRIFDHVRLTDDDFTPENFKPGSSGQSELFKQLVLNTRIDEHSAWKGVKGAQEID